MLQLSRARRSALGTLLLKGQRLEACVLRARHLATVAVAVTVTVACSPAAPSARAPDGAAAAPSDAEPTASIEPGASESSPAIEAAPVEPSAASAEPVASAPTPRDTRGKQEIQQVMANNRDKVRACYDAALARNLGIKGDLVVDFTIDPRGEVKQAEVNWSQSDIHIPELDSCAADAVRSLKFPASSRGLESKVSFPFNFNPPRDDTPPSQRLPDSPVQKPSSNE